MSVSKVTIKADAFVARVENTEQSTRCALMKNKDKALRRITCLAMELVEIVENARTEMRRCIFDNESALSPRGRRVLEAMLELGSTEDAALLSVLDEQTRHHEIARIPYRITELAKVRAQRMEGEQCA